MSFIVRGPLKFTRSCMLYYLKKLASDCNIKSRTQTNWDVHQFLTRDEIVFVLRVAELFSSATQIRI
jgi:hypothetical protein